MERLALVLALLVALAAPAHPQGHARERPPLQKARAHLLDPNPPKRALVAEPSFFVIVIDDIGKWDLDHVPVPEIDELEAQSVSFVRANTTSSMCSPSRTALCGVYGRRLGIGRIVQKDEEHDLELGTATLASRLGAAGYETGFFGKWHLSSDENYDSKQAPGLFGFDTWRAVATHNLGVALSDGSGPGSYVKWDRVDDGALSIETTWAPAAQAAAAAAWWTTTPGPKLCWLCFSAAHAPYEMPPAAYLPQGYVPPASPTDRDRYEATIQALDNQIGLLLDFLDDELDDAVVIFWSDNGTPIEVPGGQDPAKVKQSVYEGGVGTPFFVRAPGLWPGVRRRLVSTLDVHDTLLELAGLAPATADSISFADLFGQGGEGFREWTFAERFVPNGPPGFAGPFTARERMVRDRDDWKLIVEEDHGAETFRALFDLPDETNPVSNPTKQAELEAILAGI